MFTDIEQVKGLLKRFRDGTCTREEEALIKKWWLHYRKRDASAAEHTDEAILNDLNGVWRILNVGPMRQIRRRRIMRVAVFAGAAVLLMIVSIGIKRLNERRDHSGMPTWVDQNNGDTIIENDVAPGGPKATLLTPNGIHIALAEDQTGIVIDDTITYMDGQSILHKRGSTSYTPNARYGLVTPRGGTYRLRLSDGTVVWLNADSKIEYPLAFVGENRLVRVTGEAFFEVASNSHQPFIVKTPNETIRVSGTKFNIAAYPDDDISTTTLAEGQVEVTIFSSEGPITRTLSPNQQSRVSGQTIIVENVHAARSIAWKDNVFHFQEAQITDVMKILSRWYAIDVAFEGEPTLEKFSGKISRNRNISQVLELLERTKAVRFRLETNHNTNERRIIVMK